MNNVVKPRSAARHLWWLIPFTAIIMVPTILAVSVVSCLGLGGEAKTLRNSMMESSSLNCERKIEVSVGGLLFTLARIGVSFFDVPPEVRAGIKTVREARVGVYEVKHGRGEIRASELLESADRAMSDCKWERFVTVVNRNELVAIYTPKETDSSRELEVSVVVLNENEMVIVSARANPEPLFKLAMREAGLENNESSPLRWLTSGSAR